MQLCSEFKVVPQALMLAGSIVSEIHFIAGGGFADVFQGIYQQVPVAIKRLRIFQVSDESARERNRKVCWVFFRTQMGRLTSIKAFYKEALIWHQLDHPHILPFPGVIEDESGIILSMVLPWMENGNVRQYLNKKMKEAQFRARYIPSIIQWVCENFCIRLSNSSDEAYILFAFSS